MVKLKNSLRKMRKGQENWSRDVKKNRGGTRVQDVHPPDNEIQKEKKKNVGGKNYQRNHSRLCLNTILQMEKAQSAQNTGWKLIRPGHITMEFQTTGGKEKIVKERLDKRISSDFPAPPQWHMEDNGTMALTDWERWFQLRALHSARLSIKSQRRIKASPGTQDLNLPQHILFWEVPTKSKHKNIKTHWRIQPLYDSMYKDYEG